MIRVEETLDIKAVEAVRLASLRRGLDDNDNLSWHIALKDNGKMLGAARLYRVPGGLFADKPAVLSGNRDHFEMLFRTLLLKCEALGAEFVFIGGTGAYYEAFGFRPHGGGMRAEVKTLVFPKMCQGQNIADPFQ